MKCMNCGLENEDGARFCDECGTEFPSKTNSNNDVPVVSMGDKNVVAGDVVAHKETYKVTGDATIVKNEDASKKMCQCVICGKNLPISGTFECQSCHQIVCEECFDKTEQKCKRCVSVGVGKSEEDYRAAVIEALSDGKIDIADRKKLMALQRQLGVSVAVAVQIEKELKPEAGGRESRNAAAFDKANTDKAYDLLYKKGDYKLVAELLAPIYERNPSDEKVLAMYIAAMAKYNPVGTIKLVKSLNADFLPAALALIDIDLAYGDLTSVEKRIHDAEGIWAESDLLKCRKIQYFVALCKATEDTAPLMEAAAMTDSINGENDPIVRSWAYYVKDLINKELGEERAKITPEFCDSNGLLWDIVSQNDDKSGALYCIIDLSRGRSASKYPVFYMDTSSVAPWPIEFKTDLLVLRKIMPGKYIVGHGEPEFPTMKDIENYVEFKPTNANPKRAVTISRAYYIGVFPFTQKQWELVCGPRDFIYSNPEYSAARPADNISYQDVRGKGVGCKWPLSDKVDSNSFLSIIRKKTGLCRLDLPTEAQWEIACRAGCESDYYNGKDLNEDFGVNVESVNEICRSHSTQDLSTVDNVVPNDDDDGSYSDSVRRLITRIGSSKVTDKLGTSIVGSYKPNNWGLYDFIGNVEEWCINHDFDVDETDDLGICHYNSKDAIDPCGWYTTEPESDNGCAIHDNIRRVLRGGNCFEEDPVGLTVWHRRSDYGEGENIGFRLSMPIVSEAVEALLSQNEPEKAEVSPESIEEIKKAARIGDLYAEYFLAKVAATGDLKLPSVSECERLFELNVPIAGRALALYELAKNTDDGREHAISIYRKNMDLGDVESSIQLRKLFPCSVTLENAVLSILKKAVAKCDEDVHLYFGDDLAGIHGVVAGMLRRHLGWADEYLPGKIFAVVTEHVEDDELEDRWDSNFIAFTSDGVFSIQGGAAGPAAYFSGFVTWLEICLRGKIETRGEDNQILTFCQGVKVVHYGHSDAMVSAYRDIVAFVKNNALTTQHRNEAEQVQEENLSKITEEEFNNLLKSSTEQDVDVNYYIGLCYENGWGTQQNISRALAYFRKAAGFGHIKAIQAYERYFDVDEETRDIILRSLTFASRQFGAKLLLRKDLDEKYPACLQKASEHAVRFGIERGRSLPDKVLVAICGDKLMDGIGLFFATDGVYWIGSDGRGRNEGSGYVPWPDFVCDCTKDGDWNCVIVIRKDPRVAVNPHRVDVSRDELPALLNCVSSVVAKLFTTEYSAGKKVLKLAKENSATLGQEQEARIEYLARLGCAEACVFLGEYYLNRNHFDWYKAQVARQLCQRNSVLSMKDLVQGVRGFRADLPEKVIAILKHAKAELDDERGIEFVDELNETTIRKLDRALDATIGYSEVDRKSIIARLSPWGATCICVAVEGLYIVNENPEKFANGFISWEAFVEFATLKLCGKDSDVVLVAEQFELRFEPYCGDAEPSEVVAVLTELHKAAKAVCCSKEKPRSTIDYSAALDSSSNEEYEEISKAVPKLTLTVGLEGSCCVVGRQRFDSIDDLRDGGADGYEDVTYYDDTEALPSLDGTVLKIKVEESSGAVNEYSYQLSHTGCDHDLKLECVGDVFDSHVDLDDNAVCLTMLSRAPLSIKKELSGYEGEFDSKEITIEYVTVRMADKEVAWLIKEVKYKGEVLPYGYLSVFDEYENQESEVWLVDKSGSREIDLASLSSCDDEDEDDDTTPSESEVDDDEDGDDEDGGVDETAPSSSDEDEDEDVDEGADEKPAPSTTDRNSSRRNQNSTRRPRGTRKKKALSRIAILGTILCYCIMWMVPGFWYTLLAMAVFVGAGFWMAADAAGKNRTGIMMLELLLSVGALIYFLVKMIAMMF